MTLLLVEAILTGILTGGVYALMASGLTIIYGVMNVINVAQGILVILGAYLTYALEQSLHLDLFVSLLITMPSLFVLGAAIEWAALRRIKQAGNSLAILVMFAVALLIEGVLSFIFGTDYVQLHAWYIEGSFKVGGFYIAYIYLFAFLLSVALLFGLYVLVYRTKFGYGLRASMQNPSAALLVGIDVERISTITFGIGVSLAAAGGVAFGATNAFNPASSYDLISRLLVIIVLGGMGSLQGAFLASLIMLIIGDITSVVWTPVWSSTVFFAFLIILLVVRPQGLFGQQIGRTQ
ncbi:MAG: branched-chain amino acid ABC transporter permease [Chloroflexi bacterium]|nr:branched-chain amino acid ABC transporter permease [Chloroflexota bacterium]